MLVRSMGAVVAAFLSTSNFSTGKLSPVSELWVTNRSFAATMRTSAGIMSPAASSTMSPGTSCETAISWGLPSRITVAVTEIMALSLAAALSALASWMSFRPTPRAIMSDIMMPARGSPVANEMLARTASRITSGLRTACQSSLPRLVRWSLGQDVRPIPSESGASVVIGQPFGTGRESRKDGRVSPSSPLQPRCAISGCAD